MHCTDLFPAPAREGTHSAPPAVATMPPQGPVWPDRDDNDRAIPVFPGPRRSPETQPPTPTPAPAPAGGWTR